MSVRSTSVRHARDSRRHPNILLLILDDLRPDLGAYGAQWARTPHLDGLAESGAVMLRAYASVANCCPSRAALLTGLRPDFNGVLDLYSHVRDKQPSVVTLPQRFRQAGYISVGFGKVFHQDLDDELSWTPEAEFATNRSCRGREVSNGPMADHCVRRFAGRPCVVKPRRVQVPKVTRYPEKQKNHAAS